MAKEVLHLLDSSLEKPKNVEHRHFSLSVFSTKSRYHDKNQDSLGGIWFTDGSCVLAVADGVGSCPRAHEASQIGVQEVTSMVAKAGQGGSYRGPILNAFERANERILSELKRSGSTLVAIEIHNDWIRAYHAGDSLAMLFGGRGKQKYLTVGHSPFDMAQDVGLNTVHQDESEMRNTVTNCLGELDMRIEVGPKVATSPQDTVIMGSDGLFDNVDVELEVQHSLSGGPEAIVGSLTEKSLSHMYAPVSDAYCKPDDLTLLAFRRNPP